ncbi:unnamed protein product, partial [Allacma fusca]
SLFPILIVLVSFPRSSSQHGGIKPLTGDEETRAHPDCTESILMTDKRPRYDIEPEEDIFEKPEVKCEWNII